MDSSAFVAHQDPAHAMTIGVLLASPQFWASLAGAFAGAIAAFVLGLVAQWRRTTDARRSAGNLTIIVISQKYSEAKAIYDSIFVKPVPEMTRTLGRPLLYFDFKAAMDLPSEAPPLNIEPLGFLADSHDPDILVRLVAAKSTFAAMLKIAAAHERLHIELQNRAAKLDPSKKERAVVGDLPKLIGMDLMFQLKAAVEGLQNILPELQKSLLRLGDEFREVLLYQLPARSFLRFIPDDRGKLSEAKLHVIKPAWWRRVV